MGLLPINTLGIALPNLSTSEKNRKQLQCACEKVGHRGVYSDAEATVSSSFSAKTFLLYHQPFSAVYLLDLRGRPTQVLTLDGVQQKNEL